MRTSWLIISMLFLLAVDFGMDGHLDRKNAIEAGQEP